MYNNLHGIKALGHALKGAMPSTLFRRLLTIYHMVLGIVVIPLTYYANCKVERRINLIRKSNRPVRFCFYVVLSSMFQWRRIFELMLQDVRFEPFIVVTPRIGWQIGDMEKTHEKTYAALVKEFGTKYIRRGYDNGQFKNYENDSDACAMMNLYSGLAERSFETRYLAMHGIPVFGSAYFYDQGTVHSPEYDGMRSLKFVRRFFCGNQCEVDKFIRYQKISWQSDRVKLTGCPKTDAIIGKQHSAGRRVVLIAPHHSVIPTVDSGLCLGNFLRFKDYLLNLPERYRDIDWILRPHPHLKLNLIKNIGWAEDEWDQMVSAFVSHANARFEDDGPYYDAFKKSDAIIHDCGSFLPEYFYTGNPICYMLASEEAKNAQFDEWGQELLAHTYQALSEEDITRFIEDVVIGGKDTMREMRHKFAKERVMINYPHASEAIVEDIAELLGRGKEKLV